MRLALKYHFGIDFASDIHRFIWIDLNLLNIWSWVELDYFAKEYDKELMNFESLYEFTVSDHA